MIEAGAPSTGGVCYVSSLGGVPAPPGALMVALPEVPRNAEGAKRRAKPATMGGCTRRFRESKVNSPTAPAGPPPSTPTACPRPPALLFPPTQARPRAWPLLAEAAACLLAASSQTKLRRPPIYPPEPPEVSHFSSTVSTPGPWVSMTNRHPLCVFSLIFSVMSACTSSLSVPSSVGTCKCSV